MATYYVSQATGDDSSGDGSEGNPYASISKPFYLIGNSTAAHEIIIMDSETYLVSNAVFSGGSIVDDSVNQIISTSGFLVRNLHLRAASGQRPILDGQNSATFAVKYFSSGNSMFHIEGIEFRNFTTNAFLSTSGDRPIKVTGCTIKNIGADAIQGRGSGSIIERCVLHNITGYGFFGFRAATIKNCLFFDIGRGAITFTAGGSGDGVVEHNTFFNCGDTRNGSSAAPYVIHASAPIRYNVLTSNSASIAGIRAVNNDNKYNLVFDTKSTNSPFGNVDNFYSGHGAGTGALQVDPLLVSTQSSGFESTSSAYDFNLGSGSPAQSAAVDSTRVMFLTSGSQWYITGSRTWDYTHEVIGVISSSHNDLGALESHATILGVKTQNVASVTAVDD